MYNYEENIWSVYNDRNREAREMNAEDKLWRKENQQRQVE